MNHLLKIEWLKLKNYTAFKVLFILFAVGIVITNYVVFIVNKNIVGNSTGASLIGKFNPYSFTSTWQTTSYATGWLLILPAMLLIIITTNEYTYRTNRQNIIDGLSRQQFISVKLVLAFLLATISTILVFLTALSFGLASNTEFSFNSFSHVGYFFLKALSYNMLAILVSVLIKKTGFAIGLYFIYLSAENFLSQLLDVFSNKIKENTGTDLGSIGDYLPMNAADGLLTFPDNPLKGMATAALPTNYTWVVILFVVFYLVFFVWGSFKKYVNADL